MGREEEAGYSPRARLILVACLLLGVVATSRWLWVMSRHKPSYGVLTWATWLALLLGPLLVSARRILALMQSRRRRDV